MCMGKKLRRLLPTYVTMNRLVALTSSLAVAAAAEGPCDIFGAATPVRLLQCNKIQ